MEIDERGGRDPLYRTTSRQGLFAGMKVYFVTDRLSQSITEWLVAEVRHHLLPKQTKVLGGTTGGKAVVQCYPEQDLSMKITCGEWNIAGRKVHGKGIDPDEHVDFSTCGSDYRCIVRMVAARD